MTDVAIGARKVERADAQRGSKEKEPRDFVQDLNLILLALDCIALVLCVLSIENGWTGNSWDPNVLTELSKWGITIVSIASAVLILIRYKYQLLCMIEEPPSLPQLVLEFVVHFLHVPPRSLFGNPAPNDWMFRVGYQYDPRHGRYPLDNLNALLVIRMYILLRVICEQSYYDDENVMAVGALNHVRIDLPFVIKCIIRRSPVRSLGISLLCTQIWGSYNMRLWERRYSHHLDVGCVNDLTTLDIRGDDCLYYHARSFSCGLYDDGDFAASEQCCACGGGKDDPFSIAGSEADWSNAFWLVFVTMTSVGYGDYYPNTHLGRVTAAVCVLLFTLFISLFIGVVADEMQLGSAQEKVYEYADAHANHQRVRQIAAEVLTQFLRAKATPDLKKKPWLKPQWVHDMDVKHRLAHRSKVAPAQGSPSGSRPRKTPQTEKSMSTMRIGGDSKIDRDELSGVSDYLLDTFKVKLDLHKRAVARGLPTQYETQNNAMYDWMKKSQEREAALVQMVEGICDKLGTPKPAPSPAKPRSAKPVVQGETVG